MSKSKPVIIVLLILVILVAAGVGICLNSNKVDDVNPASEVSKVEAINPLTGDKMADSDANKRPVAIMVENSKQALPQWGLSSADIVFETLVEGGITRNIALFSDISSIPKVGPVRSVREYYPTVAAPFNSLFVHFGGSDTGYKAIDNLKLYSIDGTSSSDAFNQDQSRASRGKEHTYYTSAELLKSVIKSENINMIQNTQNAFLFAQPGKDGDFPEQCSRIGFKFSDYCPVHFDYDNVTGKYEKSEFGAPQIDGNSNIQISVDNVFVLYANITGSADGSQRRSISFEEGGSGKYISKGRYTDIHWTKQSGKDMFDFNDMEGSALNVNPGKTWICMIPVTEKNSVVVSP